MNNEHYCEYGKWEMGNGKWEMGNGQWNMENALLPPTPMMGLPLPLEVSCKILKSQSTQIH